MAGVRVPVVPMAHEYLITQPFRDRGDEPLPTLRDPDLLIYFREEGGGLVMGGYERGLRALVTPRRRARPGRDPARLQRSPPRGRLGPLRGDRRQLASSRAGHGGRDDHATDQRPRGLHAGRRVLPRRDGGARTVRGGRLLCPRPRGRRGHREGDGGVDRGGRAEPGPVGDGHSPLRCAVPLRPPTRSSAPARSTRPITTSSTRATSGRPGGPCAPPPQRHGTGSTALRSARSPDGSASTTTPATSRPATSRSVRAGGPASCGRPRSAPSTTPPARASGCSTSLLQQGRDRRPGRGGVPGAPVRQPRGA